MIKVCVWTKELRRVVLNNLRPRRYMCGWTFEQCLRYIKNELYFNDVDVSDIREIEFFDEREMWVCPIYRREQQ